MMSGYHASIWAVAAIAFSTPAWAAQDSAPVPASVDSDTAEITKGGKPPKKIKDRRHPDYIRCRSQAIIGSLAKKRRVCMTNREWTVHIREGNKRANQFVNDIQGGMRTDSP